MSKYEFAYSKISNNILTIEIAFVHQQHSKTIYFAIPSVSLYHRVQRLITSKDAKRRILDDITVILKYF